MSEPNKESSKRPRENSSGKKVNNNTNTDSSPSIPPNKKLNQRDNMAKQNLPRMGMIRGQKTEINTKICPISQVMERQLQMIMAESEQEVDILSPAENNRRNKIVEAHLTLSTPLLMELSMITVGYMINFSKTLKDWESNYKDFIKTFQIDFTKFDQYAKNALLKNDLDKDTSEKIISGIKGNHSDAIKQGSTFYQHICTKMQYERESFTLQPSDIRALESNIKKAINQGFVDEMNLKIKNLAKRGYSQPLWT